MPEFVIVTLAFGTAAPDWSVTEPAMVADRTCATAIGVAERTRENIKSVLVFDIRKPLLAVPNVTPHLLGHRVTGKSWEPGR